MEGGKERKKAIPQGDVPNGRENSNQEEGEREYNKCSQIYQILGGIRLSSIRFFQQHLFIVIICIDRRGEERRGEDNRI